jgi:carbon storage regulator CsrA
MPRLCITRKPEEIVVIDETTIIKIGEVGRGRVQLVIEAPANIRIRRGELPPERPATLPMLRAVPAAA